MDEQTSKPLPISQRRYEVFKLLWPRNYGPKRMLEFALHEQLFDLSQLKAAETPEGREALRKIVWAEFRDIQKDKIEQRRAVVVQLMALMLSKREITNHCIEKGLVPNSDPQSAYHCVRKDMIRMVRKMRADDIEYIPVAKPIFVQQQARLYRDAMSGQQAAAMDKNRRGQASLMMVAMKASENIAIVNKVDVNGRMGEIQKGFDLATEAARAIIEHTQGLRAAEEAQERIEGNVIDVEPVEAQEAQ